MLHWVLVHLYSRLAQNPGASANYNSKKKVKEKGVEGLSLEKRTRLTKFPSHKMRESFTMQNHNIFFEQRAGCQRCQPLLKKLGAYLSQVLMKDNTFSFVWFSSFLYESRLPKLGGRCQAIVSCLMGTSYPCWLVKQCRGVWPSGVATKSRKSFWIDLDKELAGWYGRWRSRRRQCAVSFLDFALTWLSAVRCR